MNTRSTDYQIESFSKPSEKRDTRDIQIENDKLRKRLHLLETLIERTTDSVFVKDTDGQYIFSNTAAANAVGKNKSELLGCYDDDVFPVEMAKEKRKSDLFVMDSGQIDSYEQTHMAPDGRQITLSIIKTPVSDAFGTIIGVAGIARDISENKRKEFALKASEEKYRALIETTNTGYLIIDMKGKVLDANQEYVQLTGNVDLGDIIGKPVTDWTAEYEKTRNLKALAQCIKDGFIKNLEIDYVDGNGRITPIEINATVIGVGDSKRIISLCRDISERKQSERKAQMYLRLHQTLTDAFVMVDMSGYIVEFNDSYQKMLRYSAEELLHRTYSDITPTKWHAFEANIVEKQIIPYGQSDAYEKEYIRKDGGVFPVELRTFLLRDKNNEPEAMWAIVRDITDRKFAERALIADKTAAENANATKSRFLAAASHDLRQPIQALNLFQDALLRTPLNNEQKDIVHYQSLSINSMSEMLNALLDISRLDAGVVKPKLDAIPLEILFSRVRTEAAPLADERSLRFNIYFPPGGMTVLTDSDLFQMLMRNLVGNAIKYTRQGGVLVGVRYRGDQALVQVWDTGIGIEPEQIGSIFEEYYQVSNPERNRTKGLGLGLAIVQRLARLLKTEVVCRSRPGRGSVFEFNIPLVKKPKRRGQSQITKVSAADLDYPDLVGLKIVIIEDSSIVAMSLKVSLQSLGMNVTTFTSAEKALEDEAIINADFYITDLRLPGLDGIQFLNLIQKRSPIPIKALLLTGDTSSDRVGLMQSCSWPVLFKPHDLATLVNTIESQFQYSIGTRKSIANARKAEVARHSRQGNNESAAKTRIEFDNKFSVVGRRVVLIEDNSLVAFSLKSAMEPMGMIVTRFHDGEEALEHPDIVNADFYISDLILPGMNGIELLDALQKRSPHPLKAVLVTGDTSPDHIALMNTSGWRVLSKPYDISELISIIGQTF